MAEGNIPALAKEREIFLYIHTDESGFSRLSNELRIPNYVSFHCRIDVYPEEKYSQLGRHQQHDLKSSKETGADYHLLMPDFIYSDNCFAGVLKAVERGHKAIARLVVSTTMETILPELNKPRSAIDLATLSLQHIHKGVKHWLVNGVGLPNTHVLAWEGKNTLTMCSPHQTPVYIANEVIKISDGKVSLDAILDKVIEGDIYCPIPDDGIVIIEVSPKDSRESNDKKIDLKEFCRIFKCDVGNSLKQLEIFKSKTVDRINRKALGDVFWNDVEISEQKSIVDRKLMENLYS